MGKTIKYNKTIKRNNKSYVSHKNNSQTKCNKKFQFRNRQLTKKRRKYIINKGKRHGGMGIGLSREQEQEQSPEEIEKLLNTGIKSGITSIYIQGCTTSGTIPENIKNLQKLMHDNAVNKLSSYIIKRLDKEELQSACSNLIYEINIILLMISKLHVTTIHVVKDANKIITTFVKMLKTAPNQTELINNTEIMAKITLSVLNIFKNEVEINNQITYSPLLAEKAKTELLNELLNKIKDKFINKPNQTYFQQLHQQFIQYQKIRFVFGSMNSICAPITKGLSIKTPPNTLSSILALAALAPNAREITEPSPSTATEEVETENITAAVIAAIASVPPPPTELEIETETKAATEAAIAANDVEVGIDYLNDYGPLNVYPVEYVKDFEKIAESNTGVEVKTETKDTYTKDEPKQDGETLKEAMERLEKEWDKSDDEEDESLQKMRSIENPES